MIKKSLMCTVVLTFLIAPFAVAQDSVWEMAKSEKYGTKAGGMIGRGLVNAPTCFVDLIVHTVNGTKEGPPLVGTLTGLGSGIACTTLRATSGVLDIGTFWVPGFNGLPVSKSFSNCLEGEEASYGVKPAPAPALQPAPAPAALPVKAIDRTEEPAHNPMRYVKK